MAKVKYSAINNQGIPDTRFRSENLATAPTPDGIGHRFFDTALGYERVYNGSAWLKATVTGIVDADVAVGAAIAESKLSLATDAAAGTGSRRTLGTGSLQALAGNTRLDQIAAPTAAVAFNGQRITNIADPTANTDATSMQWVNNQIDLKVSAQDWKASVRAASTADVGITGTLVNGLVMDGITLATGDRVLLKNQATASQNGIYVVPFSGNASRAADADNSGATSEVTAGMTVPVEGGGTANGGTIWLLSTAGAIVLGTTSLTFTQIGAGGSAYSAGIGLTLTGNQFSLTAPVTVALGGTGAITAAAGFNNLSPITTLGDLIYGSAANTAARLAGNTTAAKQFLTQTGNGSVSAAPAWGTIATGDVPTLNQNTTGTAANVTGTVAVANGGTGAGTAAGARTNLGATAKFSATLGALTAGTGLATAHGLGTADLVVVVRDVASGSLVEIDIVIDATNITLTSAVAIAASAVRIVAVG